MKKLMKIALVALGVLAGTLAHALFSACVADPALECRLMRIGGALLFFGAALALIASLAWAALADESDWTGPCHSDRDGDGEGGHASAPGVRRGSSGAETPVVGAGHS
jgi:hypothetical protein